MDISGTRALVTGAAGGLGTAIAEHLSAKGATVVLSGRNETALTALAKRLGGEVLLGDLTMAADVEKVGDALDGIDILVANAGVGGDTDATAPDTALIDSLIDVNLRAPIHLATRFAAEHLASEAPGHIVLIGSLAGLAASPTTYMYNATKFGLRGFGLAFAQDLHGTNVGCSLVEPGFIRDAGLFANSGIDLPPGVRLKSPGDVGAAVVTAIETGRTEVFVAPTELRALSTFATIAPVISAAVQRRLDVSARKSNG